MLSFAQPVKFIGTERKSGEKNGKQWSIQEAVVFVPDLGRIKIIVNGLPQLPEPQQMISLMLSVEQGSFQSMRPVWNEQSKFQVVK